ncbi:ABC transporter permease [Rhizobium sp. C4]|uniref:ABC transporter permease n=1 Tax=Rhizobium sp. C4 TaxID=1349800 RepID=UPI001E4A0221|nr:ABC transporter permease [Rhizobium sp. C4]MCD2172308.1 ABC transporter permease [Rhizobium sp. C4]
MTLARTIGFIASLAVAILFIFLWHLVTLYKLVPPVFLPPPMKTYDALVQGLASGPLLKASLATLQRMLLGWLLACVAGVGIGALVGTSPVLMRYLGPTLEAFRPIPASALIPVLIAIVGLSEGMILSVIAFGALWPMLLATIHGLQSVEPLLYDVAGALRMNMATIISKIGLPSAVPDILAAMRLSLTIALILATVCEMLSGNTGLGQWLLYSARQFSSANLFAGILILGVFGYLTNALMTVAERHLLRWKSPHEANRAGIA